VVAVSVWVGVLVVLSVMLALRCVP
jgi:hypothetical protein